MPHSTESTTTTIHRRDYLRNTATGTKKNQMEKFPEIDTSFVGQPEDTILSANRFDKTPQTATLPLEAWHRKAERAPLPSTWRGQIQPNDLRGNGYAPPIRKHGRQKSLSDAFNTIRTRKGSISANAHEIADALKVPVSQTLIVWESLYYTCEIIALQIRLFLYLLWMTLLALWTSLQSLWMSLMLSSRRYLHSLGRAPIGRFFHSLRTYINRFPIQALCIVWYGFSAASNNTSKKVLNSFGYTATLTWIQFVFVCSGCLFVSLSSKHSHFLRSIPELRNGIRRPTKQIFWTTLPMALFQIIGHLLSSSATKQISVSLVHTIKGLSPLISVLVLRFWKDIRYPLTTYISLIPLTIGVMLACSGKGLRGDFPGIFCAFAASIVFVIQNIWSKKLFNAATVAESGRGEKIKSLDKLNLLFYSTLQAAGITSLYWFYAEGHDLIWDFLTTGKLPIKAGKGELEPMSMSWLVWWFLLNGITHFGQNVIAFILLAKTSPVTYSVASLIKRVFVILASVVIWRAEITGLQGFGILLTCFGLYLYDRCKEDKIDKRAALAGIKEEPLLPTENSAPILNDKGNPMYGLGIVPANGYALSGGIANPYINGRVNGTRERSNSGSGRKRADSLRSGGERRNSHVAWLAPGTKAEETWKSGDVKAA